MSRTLHLVEPGPDDPPNWCFRANAQGDLPTCTQVDGQWHRTYENSGFGSSGDGSGFAGGIAILMVLSIIVGILATVWRVSTARRMARESGMSERDATTMSLLSDDGLEATYLAANLREPRPATPAPVAPTSPSAARLRELQELLDQGLITQAEYDERRRAVIDGV